MNKTNIEWTDATWNPVVGCSRVSQGCQNCYAELMSWRLQNNPKMNEKYDDITRKTTSGQIKFTGKVNFDQEALLKPLYWKKPRMVFISMSDLFHPGVSDDWLYKVFAVMLLCLQHTFQVLTKRPQRMWQFITNFDYKYLESCAEEVWGNAGKSGKNLPKDWIQEIRKDESGKDFWFEYYGNSQLDTNIFSNIWLGVSAEDQETANERIPLLMKTPAAVRFVSLEPMLGVIDLTSLVYENGGSRFQVNALDGTQEQLMGIGYSGSYPKIILGKLDWVIVGGESGRKPRPMHPAWVRQIQGQCANHNTAFFFKQWGTWEPWESWQPNQWTSVKTSESLGDLHEIINENGEATPGWYSHDVLMHPGVSDSDYYQPDYICMFQRAKGKKNGDPAFLDGEVYQGFPQVNKTETQ